MNKTFWVRMTRNAWHLYPVAGVDSIDVVCVALWFAGMLWL